MLAKLPTLRVTLRVCNFLSDLLKTRNAAKSRRMRAFDLAGPTGLEPATSGVTGRAPGVQPCDAVGATLRRGGEHGFRALAQRRRTGWRSQKDGGILCSGYPDGVMSSLVNWRRRRDRIDEVFVPESALAEGE